MKLSDSLTFEKIYMMRSTSQFVMGCKPHISPLLRWGVTSKLKDRLHSFLSVGDGVAREIYMRNSDET
jgi:hypothetical protein